MERKREQNLWGKNLTPSVGTKFPIRTDIKLVGGVTGTSPGGPDSLRISSKLVRDRIQKKR